MIKGNDQPVDPITVRIIAGKWHAVDAMGIVCYIGNTANQVAEFVRKRYQCDVVISGK